VTGDAVVLGEAVVDLLEGEVDGGPVYRPVIGGGPLNVAVGVARLGGDARFTGTLSDDVWGDRIAAFLTGAGVGVSGVRRVAAPSTLAVTTFAGPEPAFRFYGDPPSYSLLAPADLDQAGLAAATVLYAGSISLLAEPFRAAARLAWSVPGPLRVFDPNVRPTLLPTTADVAAQRDLVEEFAATAHLVKLSEADVAVLYGRTPVADAADRLRAAGAEAVVVTCGARGAWLATAGGTAEIPAPVVRAVDTTGAGDSVMAALIARLLSGAPRVEAEDVRFALSVGALVCERHGGASAMPTMAELGARFPARTAEEMTPGR
jgi:fructokinase